MTYSEYMDQITGLVVITEEDGLMRLRSDYRYQIANYQHKISEIEDFEGIKIEDVYEDLKLFVEDYNKVNDPVRVFMRELGKEIKSKEIDEKTND